MRAVLTTIGSIWLLWTLYALIVPEPEDKVPSAIVLPDDTFVAPRLHDDPSEYLPASFDVMSTLSQHLGVPLTNGNQVKLLVNGVEIFAPMLDAINKAGDSIRMLTYVYWTGDIADRFAHALSEAARRGVSVRLLLDAFGSRKIEQRHLDLMEQAGVRIAWFHPFRWYNIRRLNLRTHRKVLVVDSELGFTGGVGIAQEWSGDAGGKDEWRDNHFSIRGPAVRFLEGSFAENWLNATGELITTAVRNTTSQTEKNVAKDDVRLLVLSTSPRGDMSPISFTYWTAITAAQQTVDIATPYFVPDAELREAIMALSHRGVKVRLLVPVKTNDSVLVRLASQSHFHELIQAGVELYEYIDTMMHTKIIVIDNKISIIGSPNFDNRSFELNDEIVLVSDSSRFASELVSQFEIDVESSLRINEDHTVPGFFKRTFAIASLLLREQL